MKFLSLLATRSRATVIAALFAGLLSGAATVGLIAVLQQVLDRLDDPGVLLILSFAAAASTVLLAGAVSSILLIRLAQRTIQELRMELCRQILDSGMRRIERIGTARLQSALTDDVQVITGAVSGVPLLVMNSAIVVGAFVYIGLLSLKVLLGMAGVLALGLVLYQLPMRRAAVHLRRAREHQDAMHAHLESVTHGAKELKLDRERRAAVIDDGVGSTGRLLVRDTTRGVAMYTVAGSWGQLLFLASIGVMLFAGPRFGISGDDLTGFTLAVLYINTPLVTVLNLIPTLGRAATALQSLDSLDLGDESELRVLSPPRIEEPARASLRLRAAAFRYGSAAEGMDFAVGPIDADFEPGTITFLVGGNGSGKTTLAKMVCGLYPPSGGEISLNGVPVTGTEVEALRQSVAGVFSDVYLFRTLPTRPDVDQEANRLLAHLGMDRKVTVRDGEFSTIALSTGQRKRLALVCALLSGRPVLLFDEWAADQDPEFRDFFYTEVLPDLRKQGRTVVAVTHDDRYFGVADQILKLERGKAVEAAIGAAPAASAFGTA
ncbi:cyclic peptide export ABC transporter [Streptomyces caniscabiei]|uniref:cyclic peptide export ABC transporter n=1 Tax=Streptomyces caniscabiei TaxID=2746961 RepID=UPI0029AB9750|nr:cyclic peptide export ABC transporter [Streptomyces caniscabiei]MDX2599653.1 cyclic peptide export ABC transporter [Streptomyces caniscabiei]MDX2735052.1 cyclic peptide export ABC transporter [Streptomyces caniscabiei]MDX2776748.1 cyclic peptide export ABC transporter [Streptomyces caniscabiei]